MEWDIEIHGGEGYVEIITSGFADKEGTLDMAQAIKKTMRAHRMTKVLIDHRNIRGVEGNILDIYERPKIFRLIGVLLKIRIAEIINPEHRDHFRFLETVCQNQGFKLSIFQDKDEALSWLLG